MALPNYSLIPAKYSGDVESGAVHDEQLARLHHSHATEVLGLRRRIQRLEQALADASVTVSLRKHANQTRSEPFPQVPPAVVAVSSGECVSLTGARAAQTDPQKVATTAGSPEEDNPGQDNGPAGESVLDPIDPPVSGAEAWNDGTASFAERLAARAFFAHDEPDDSARRWLLKGS